MRTDPLIGAQELADRVVGGAGKLLICDCSFDLANPASGEEIYRQGHIPHAQYLHLDNDLSSAKTGLNGRHPLPDAERFVQRMKSLGANDDTLIVAYDNVAGMYAARLWWLLGWVGHRRRVVLDGGFESWITAGLDVQGGRIGTPERGNFSLRVALASVVDRRFVLANISLNERVLVDARNAERFRGENETIDPRAGHIPGAKNRYFQSNLDEKFKFKPAEQLRTEFQKLLPGVAPEHVIHQCGSGVTACHNALAMDIAGLHGSALYAGSWSEWSQHEDSPVRIGPD